MGSPLQKHIPDDKNQQNDDGLSDIENIHKLKKIHLFFPPPQRENVNTHARLGRGQRETQRESLADSTPSVKPNVGPELMTLS